MPGKTYNLWQSNIVRDAIKESFIKLDPRTQRRNVVMFLVELGAVLTTIISIADLFNSGDFKLDIQISLWLWFTVLFANFAEAIAEGRGRAQAESLRQARSEAVAKRVLKDGGTEIVLSTELTKGDLIVVDEGEVIPGDGEIIEGIALVDESAVTGESAPVIREPGGSKSGVTGGTRLVSGHIKVCISTNPGETFLDKMIAMVESAKRQKTPNEWALEILLIGLSVIFIVVIVTLVPFANYSGVTITVPVLVALLVCLMPTTIGGLLPAIGIAGMERLLHNNVVSLSGKAVEASGNVDVVLLDKTGTITIGNRMATEFIPAAGVGEKDLAEAALISSLADNTPEGRSILKLAEEKLDGQRREVRVPVGSTFIPFSAETRLSGIDWDGRQIRKGAVDSIEEYLGETGCIPLDIRGVVDRICCEGGTPLLVAERSMVLGTIRLKDVVKEGIKERLANLRREGIRSVMLTGDNPATAAAIAAETGLDDFIAQARPEAKLQAILRYQEDGHTVAMIGDGTNDAPALAQADVAVAMNAGTQAAREAANMVDLDSNPAKLLDIVEIGKQILITRGSLTTFSVANDVAKYFTILPAMFVVQLPVLNVLNVMHLATPSSAVLAAIIFNAIIIPLLIPLALRGVRYKPNTAEALLSYNLLVYGLGGLIVPFIGIKIIDIIVVLLHLD